ncbi:G protein-activated inward rectifier potassium channel 3-like [Hermetia illucens]|uniref:G protein-activated inward rectifier potassium channel 3-like n=1 Tax=Hermetia illucens TaxID=343691 RepID=UPI0018CC2A54|nr:G protein-activated inward rectifier potassium channel 3-like [Hermetia illucens]
MKFNLFSPSSKSDEDSDQKPEELLNPQNEKEKEKDRGKCYSRQITIDEEPDSLESIISNPTALPITVVRSRPTSLYKCSVHGKSFSRSSSCRSRNLRPGSVRRVRKRAILKNGDCNVFQANLTGRRIRFLQDVFTTLVDSQWRWTLLVFALGFILSWLGFGLIWWLIVVTHGDLEEMHLPQHQAESGWTPCILNVNSFASCFLFSIETQHTIGYGYRATTEECPEGIFVMCIQSIAGVMIQAFMVGIVFAKMTRSKQRTQTLLFSQKAVICQRDGDMYFMFRVGDMRKSHIIGANVRAQLIRSKSSREGEYLTTHHTELEVGTDKCGSDLFFIWPMTVMHKIDENSPLYNMSAADLFYEKFEIAVVLEGTVESTGQTTQARSSYLSNEIKWGYRFEPVVTYSKERQAYEIDYSRFDQTTMVDTPLCSAKELSGLKSNLGTPEGRNKTPPAVSYSPYLTVRSMDEILPRIDEKPSLKIQRIESDPCGQQMKNGKVVKNRA